MAHPLFCWGAGVERRQSRRPRDSRGGRAGRPGDSDGIAVYWTGVPWGDVGNGETDITEGTDITGDGGRAAAHGTAGRQSGGGGMAGDTAGNTAGDSDGIAVYWTGVPWGAEGWRKWGSF